MKTILTSALAGAMLLASGTLAASQINPRIKVYTYNHFSDATYSQQVGVETGTCYGGHYPGTVYAGVYPLQGTATSFVVQEEIGWCTDQGELIYI